jgi:hypothetical protein
VSNRHGLISLKSRNHETATTKKKKTEMNCDQFCSPSVAVSMSYCIFFLVGDIFRNLLFLILTGGERIGL